MRFLSPPIVLTSATLALAMTAAVAANVPKRVAAPTYERDVLPLFQARCGACHGARSPRAGFEITDRGDVLEGGYSGAAVKPGNPEGSLVYQMLADGRMPKGPRLAPAELKKVADWIRAGAKGAPVGGHWSFRPPVRPTVPVVKQLSVVKNPIDAFLLAKLKAKGLAFAPEADRRVLIRRVTYDLIGLPPTPEEVNAFVADRSPEAYEKVVDRLLADPRHGERWARRWLDDAGYADSEGVLQEDRVRSNMWRYRDYVIRSLNADKPYDQFLREQIAGDELVDYRNAPVFNAEIVSNLEATGFLRTAVDATRDDFNANQYGEYQYRMLHDVQTIVSSTVLGLQIQCARCHSHKFEPITQKEYYQFQSLFMGAVRPRGAVLPTYRRQVVAATAAEQKHAAEVNTAADKAVAAVDAQIAGLEQEWRLKAADERLTQVAEAERVDFQAAVKVAEAMRNAAQKALLAKYPMVYPLAQPQLIAAYPEFKTKLTDLQASRAGEVAKKITLQEIRAFYDVDANPPPTPLLHRGEWLKPAEPVQPGVPAILAATAGPLPLRPMDPKAQTTGRRRALAEWLTRPNHPLTARVIVNRIWAEHFGRGIVRTLDNLGRSGARPTHPELLDWLATTFVETSRPNQQSVVSGQHSATGLKWSLKSLHRLIVTSAAYRQASTDRPAAAKVDPDNVLLWRFRPQRLNAEAIRDGILSVAGTLEPTMFGSPVALETRSTGETVPAGEGAMGRRSIYLLVRRTTPVNLLNAFDAPVIETNCPERTVSTTPTQALALTNSAFLTSQSVHFAERVLKGGASDNAALEKVFQLTVSRLPNATERAEALAFIREQTQRYAASPTVTDEGRKKAWADLCQALLSANEFSYVD